MAEHNLPPAIRTTDPAYKRAVLAMLAAGMACFNTLYCTQALLPVLVSDLGIPPSTAALTVSATTGMLALCVVPASILSERFGRNRVIVCSAVAAIVIGLLLPLAPNAYVLVALRGLQGALLAGVPATAMTWLAEELHPEALSRAMGVYIAGTTVGGLTGRIIPSVMLEFANWRWALLATSAFALVMSLVTALALPKQRRFQPHEVTPKGEFTAMLAHFKNPQLAAMFFTAFAGMGVFVSVYNFMGFRLIETFGLSEVLVGFMFLLYLAGTWSSAKAGKVIAKLGRPGAMLAGAAAMITGLLLLLPAALWCIVAGIAVFTAGFFLVHSTASGWVGPLAKSHKAESSSMYLCSYYLGSSVLGWVSGFVFMHASWLVFLGWLLIWVGFLTCTALILRLRGSVQ